MITFASRVKLWNRATGGCFVCCLESEEGNLDRIKFEEKFFLPPGPLGRIDWDTPRVLLSFVDYRRIRREPQETSEFSLLKFSFTNIPCMINDISVAKPFSQSRAAQEVALLDTANLFVLGNKWKELPKKAEHCPLMWSNTSEERSGEVDFFYNNETLKIDGRLPFVTEPIVTSYNVPSQGSEKCTMGDEMKGSW